MKFTLIKKKRDKRTTRDNKKHQTSNATYEEP